MASVADRTEALWKPLRYASQEGFAAMDQVRELGPTLRRACDNIIITGWAPPELLSWRSQLESFDGMDRSARVAAVARGLRICHQHFSAAPEEAPDSELTELPGIGPKLAARLIERGFEYIDDLIWFVPRRYDDVRTVRPLAEALAEADAGQRVTLEGIAHSCRLNRRGRRRWVDLRLRDVGDSPAGLTIRWFNAHLSLVKRFPKGTRVVVSGRLGQRSGAAEMANPDILSTVDPDGNERSAASAIIPRYSDVAGVPAATMRKACAAAVDRLADAVLDAVPRDVAARLDLGSLGEALLSLHSPPETLSEAEVVALNEGHSQWQKRLAFDELFVLGLAVARRRQLRRRDYAVPCPPAASARECFDKVLPFALTGAQERVVAEIAADLAADVPMNRLLQGDVGSGKTAVALAAAVQAIAARRQVALMAPTELLAEQHFATLSPLCEELGLRVALLSASTPKELRATTTSLLAAGELDLIIGTHALLSVGVAFADLGLVIIDEQHRFGVAQRFQLRSKGEYGAPHLLVMTATPIPRSLALTAYGDLDVSVIDELPPGRQPPNTKVLSGTRGREQAHKILRKRLEAGERAYVVCPLVAPSEDESRTTWADATSVFDELRRALPEFRVALVHGRMSALEREHVMQRFRSGAVQALVATTVIEVGVDVPEATLMIVEDAHHFGLSQLHQLRGRVGRGTGASTCVLLTRGAKTEDARLRLGVMAETCDGFRIAEEDLRIRGPGELLGKRQAGLPKLRFGDLRQHAELLRLARQEAVDLLERDPLLEAPEHRGTRQALEARVGDAEVYGAESG
jgi:ATP-dependent DNA helicase RecG